VIQNPQSDLAAEARLAIAEREALVAAREIVHKAVAWQGVHPHATLEELEVELLQLRQEFGQQLAQVLLEQREARQPVPGPVCAGCGHEMQYKGTKTLQPTTMLGDLTLERGYYYCPECAQGIFPPGSGVAAHPQWS